MFSQCVLFIVVTLFNRIAAFSCVLLVKPYLTVLSDLLHLLLCNTSFFLGHRVWWPYVTSNLSTGVTVEFLQESIPPNCPDFEKKQIGIGLTDYLSLFKSELGEKKF